MSALRETTYNEATPRRGGFNPSTRSTELPWSYSMGWEGTIAGVCAAMAAALCFLAIDFSRGDVLATPIALWNSAASLFNLGAWAYAPVVSVAGYLVLHFATFIALGELAATVVYIARMEPAVRFGAVLAFSLAELMFFCFVAVFYDLTLTGMMTWLQLVAGNIVAVATFAAMLLRHRREYPRRLVSMHDVSVRVK